MTAASHEKPPLKVFEQVDAYTSPWPLGVKLKVLAWEIDGFHSWFCSLSKKDVSQELGIRSRPNGLLESYDDAVKIASAAVQPHDAAPFGSVAWYPWAVVSYPV